MATVLVVDDEAIVREPIAASLRALGHCATCAATAQDALSLLQSGSRDLILLDVRMPEMDGIAFLTELRSTPATTNIPVILLSNITDRQLIVQAAKLGIQGYLLKSAFSMQELLQRIDSLGFTSNVGVASSVAPSPPAANAVSDGSPPRPRLPSPTSGSSHGATRNQPDVSTWPRLLTREQTLARLDQIAGGKTVAGVVAELLSVANSQRADLMDVVKVIQSDPILASRVLQLANAASTGSRARVRTVEDAARNLGVRGIQNMAMSIGIFGAFPPDERDGFNTMRCWQHSYAVAELLNLLTRERDPEQESTNHLIGLCHDLGEILLRQHFASEYSQVLAFASTHSLPVHKVEAAALGVRHPELINRLLTRIGLPTPAVQGIREFHERQIREQAAGMSLQTRALAWANLAAHGLLLAASPREIVQPITRSEWSQFSPEKPPPVLDPVAVRGNILSATNILARLPEHEERRLLQSLIPRREARIWYVRPEVFVPFDPLAFALSLCCNLTIAEDLPPDPQAWQELDGLILLGIRPGANGFNPVELARTAAANRPELPVLCLFSHIDAPSNEGNTILRSYPISLQELDEWISGI